MPRSPTSGKDIDAIARRLSETDFTSPAATWALLSSDYPQLGSNRLAALREALEVAINTSSDTAKTEFPLTPRVLQGLAYGAGSALSTGDGGDVPGLVDAPAAPSQYAAVYALCVQRATALLYLSDPMLRDEQPAAVRPPPPPPTRRHPPTSRRPPPTRRRRRRRRGGVGGRARRRRRVRRLRVRGAAVRGATARRGGGGGGGGEAD